MKKAKDNNEEIVIKQEQKHNFIILYDTVYKNTNLTSDEIALIVKLLSIAPTFKPTFEKLMDLLHIGKIALSKAVKGLKDKGYLKIERFGNSSKWTITQEPIKSLKDLNKETLINALLNYEITLKDLKQLHRLKYIDDTLFIQTKDEYIKRLIEISKTKWLED